MIGLTDLFHVSNVSEMKKKNSPKLINKNGNEFYSLFGPIIVRRAEMRNNAITNE
jgi:hypothetical protein